MRDNLSVIITALILVILIIIFPLYNVFERQDDMSYNIVLKATSEFADEVLQNGYLTEEMYSNFVSELAMTGNLYDIQLEAHRKVITKDPDGNNDAYVEQSFIDYNDDIFEDADINQSTSLQQEDKSIIGGIYTLNEKDEFYVKVKNTNTTMAGAIFDAIIPTAKKERIIADCGGIVRNNSWAKVDAEYEAVSELPIVYAYFGNDESKKVQLPTTKIGGLGQKIDNNGEDLHIKIEGRNLSVVYYFCIYDTTTTSINPVKTGTGYSMLCRRDELEPNKTYRVGVYLDSAHSQKLNDYFFYFN